MKVAPVSGLDTRAYTVHGNATTASMAVQVVPALSFKYFPDHLHEVI
jgi:hypothetical protein